MRRSRRVTATAVAATGVLGGAALALVQAPGMQATGSTQLTVDTAAPAGGTDAAALDGVLATLESEAGALRGELTAAQRELALAEQARAKAAAAAAQAAAKVVAPAPAPAPARHTTTGASGGGGEHEGHDD